MTTLDFYNLNKSQLLELDQIKHNIKSDYEYLISKIHQKNIKNKSIFFSNILSRNLDENQVLYNLCFFELARKLYQQKKINKIITKDEIQANILKKEFKRINILFYKKKINFFKNFFQLIKNVSYLLALYFLKNESRKQNLLKKKDIILVDIFFISKMFKNNSYKDRYYLSFKNFLNKSKIGKDIVFLPNIFHDALKKKNICLAEKKINLTLHSDFLKISDYFYSLFYFLRVKKFNFNNINFRGFDIKTLLIQETKRLQFSQSILMSNLNYLFFKRAKDEKLNLKLVIDWYENQIIDKGFNLVKNIFFPNIKSKGYLGLNQVFEVYDHYFPTKFEIRKKLSPNKICIMSKEYLKELKKKQMYKNFELSPSFRNENLFNTRVKFNKTFKKKNKIKVLINFTASQEDNINLIKLINKCKILFSNKIQIFIRPHQTSKKEIFLKNISKKLKYKFSERNIYLELYNSNILISRSSTACFEAMLFKLPVIITRKIFNFLPAKKYEKFKKRLWFFCNDENDVEKIINKLLKKDYTHSNNFNSKKNIENFFLKPNKKNVLKFFN